MKTSLKLIILLFAFFSYFNAKAYDIEAKNISGETIFYNIISKGSSLEVEVTFKGNSFSDTNEYSSYIIIPSHIIHNNKKYTVTSIGQWAFANSSLAYIELPNTIKEIKSYAFSSCKDLNFIRIPHSVKQIGRSAFWNCKRLYSVVLESKNPPKIEDSTFDSIALSIKFYINCASQKEYRTAPYWWQFYFEDCFSRSN
ncbi:MAG: leucine-rich repeat domain-containing protein [Bacteroidales bacterium]|jgi:hypothetical protein|nr:leucine-rich repeat domain-containing protein [Bacteroidales bacterium]